MTQINDTRWKPTPQLIEIITGLLEEQAKEKSEADFVKKFLPFGPSQWSQIHSVVKPARLNDKGELVLSYFDKIKDESRAELITQLEGTLNEIPLKRAAASRIKEVSVLQTTKIRAIDLAVRECHEKPGPERIIILRAPTGGGKTMTCNWLADKKSARVVEVRGSWRRSTTGYVPLIDIARAIGVRISKGVTSCPRIEDDIVKFCAERNIVLCFDEGEHFGVEALKLLKFLTNKTRLVCVLCIVPSEHDKWLDWWPNEASQIARRCHAIFELSKIEEADAALFFPDRHQFANRQVELEYIIREASTFGHFSLLKRVADKLDGIAGATHADVEKAVKAAQRQMIVEVKRTAN
ncbi:MAG: AAA family ATPase [Verrucomicrobiota bacterium]